MNKPDLHVPVTHLLGVCNSRPKASTLLQSITSHERSPQAICAQSHAPRHHARLQVHRDDAMANPRLPGHVAERRRRVVPPSAVLALENNTMISPTLLRLGRQDLLAAMFK